MEKNNHAPHYMADKPDNCKYCYFWLGKKRGCELDKCYYLIEEKKEDRLIKAEQDGNCRDCPYGKHTPCIGFCLVKILREIKEK